MNWKSDDIIEKYSPHGKSKLSFYEFKEPRMMMNICRVSFINLIDGRKYEFGPLWMIDSVDKGKWSENSLYFLLPIALPIDCFFIYDITNSIFTFIRFQNCWVLNGDIFDDHISIAYRDGQIPDKNEQKKYPTKSFSKPDNLNVKFSDLNWIPFDQISNFEEITKTSSVWKLEPIDNGWRKFKGPMPATTDLIVWELEKFAEYGDEQSKVWYKKIKSQTTNINYWVKASYYLGVLKREIH